jgi:hypothetical protein
LNAQHAAAPEGKPARPERRPRTKASLEGPEEDPCLTITPRLPAAKGEHSNRLRGVPPEATMKQVRQWHGQRLRVSASEDDELTHRLMSTLFQIERAQKLQRRAPGNALDCGKLRKALGFLYERGLLLRSGVNSQSVVEYAKWIGQNEPNITNPHATARSRLRRLTDLRNRIGFPPPRRGRKRATKS